MSQRNRKYWSVSVLRRRGWTNSLIRDLLPSPFRIAFDAAPVRVWFRDDVLEAEQNPEFQRRSAEKIKAREQRNASPGNRNAPRNISRLREMLEQAWIQAGQNGFSSVTALESGDTPSGMMPESGDTPSGPATEAGDTLSGSATEAGDTLSGSAQKEKLFRNLAEHYHRAVSDSLSGMTGTRRAPASQAANSLTAFLSMEQHCEGKYIPEILKNFLRAGVWMRDHLSDSLVQRTVEHYPAVLYAAAKQAAEEFLTVQPGAGLEQMLHTNGFPNRQLLREGLNTVWSVWYVPQAIRTSLSLLVALNPKDEYPQARAMRRHFILHLGGTNTGKTYAGFQRLKQVESGVYLAPLRLLALEAQETLLDAGIPCSLSTGEEEDREEGDTHIAATAEKLELKRYYAAAVIDECQMISSRQRGYAWTRAILGILSPEIHLCAAPEAEALLLRLIASCGDSYEIIRHHRQTPLVCMPRSVEFEHIRPGDALITFSKTGVLSIAEDLRQSGKEPAIIYGALPYATRRKQMEGFLNGRMRYVVATDAIGMGLNLPIRRIIFMETEKFDGVERRELKPEEIRQIAGRAGRYGMYDKGYVGAAVNPWTIRAGLEAVVAPLQYAVVGFSDLVLQVEFDLLEVLTEWNRLPTVEPYIKLDISRYISMISKMREKGFLFPKEQELRAANIPFDETEEPLRELFFHFLHCYQKGEPIEQPGLSAAGEPTLPELELYYRKLDLYFSFARTFDCPVDEEKLYRTREEIADEINEILLYRLKNNIRFCEQCGKALPLHHHGRLCDSCFQRKQQLPRSARRPH